MQQIVEVVCCNPDATAQVRYLRQSACSGDCHQCSGCGAPPVAVTITAQNPVGAKPGDRVVIRSATGPVLLAAAILYILPMALFVCAYIAGELMWSRGPLTGLIGFVAGLAAAICYDRFIAKRKTVYTITGFAEKAENRGEES